MGWYALGYMAVVLAQMLCTMIFARSALKVEMYLGRDLKKRLFTHLQTLSFSYYNTTPVGTIMARVMSDTNKIGSVFAWSLVDIFWSAAYVIGCMGVMLVLNWRLALLVIVVVPAIALLTLYFQKKILAINRQARKVNAEITRHYNEGISGAKTSKTLVIEDKNTAAFQEVTQRMRRTTVRGVLLNAVYVPIIGFLTALAVAFVLTGGGSMVLWGDIGIGELTVFVNFALVIADPVQTLARTISNFIATQANIERVSALLELRPEITDTPEVIEKYGTSFAPKRENWEPLVGHITFEDITFRYPDGAENVLEHFSLDVPAGTTVAIVGETGAGKSTLVNLACRFFEPTAGRVLIDGRDYRERSQLWLHSSVAMCCRRPTCSPAPSGRTSATAAWTPPTRRLWPRPSWRAPMTSSPTWSTAMTATWAKGAASSPQGRSSWSLLPGPCWQTPASLSWTRPPPPSTPRQRPSSKRPSPPCWRAAPASSSPTGCPPSARRT